MKKSSFAFLIFLILFLFFISSCSSLNKCNNPCETYATKNIEKPSGNTYNTTVQEEHSVCNHVFSDWFTLLPATQQKQGTKAQICTFCYKINTKHIDKICPISYNCLVIPSLGINETLFIGNFNQNNIDNNSIVCNGDYVAYKTDGTQTSCSIIAGHNYWTMGCLYNIKIDDYIYLYTCGNETIYKVVLSDEAIPTSAGDDLISVHTEETLNLYRSDKKLLKLYTCYNNNRWMVIAEKINS